jgi:anti-sigma regulatory factor (Ser/Thr protein kinase)
MSGVFYHEEDRIGLRELIRRLARSAVILGLAAGLALVLVSPLAAQLFLPAEKANDRTREMVTLGLRIFAAGLIPASLCAIFKNAYQSTERVLLTEAISVIEGLLLPMAVALVFSGFLRETGVWLYYAGGEWLALLAWGLYVRSRTGHLPWREDACLLLRKDFGVPDADLLEADIHSLDEVSGVARRAETFCMERGKSDMISKHIALCIEEMAVNTIEHGFRREGKPRILSVRVLHKPDRWVLRFRDNCRPHDPIHCVPDEDREALGIRLMLGVSTEARYTYSMNLNNLTLELPPQ